MDLNHYAPRCSNFLCRVLSYTSKDYTSSRVNAFHVLLFKGTEELLKREASIKDDDVRPPTSSQSETDVSHALAAYKR